MSLPSCRQIVVAYSIFQNGCLAGSRQKKRQLTISATRRQRERQPFDPRLHHESKCPLFPQKQTLIERVGMSALCQKQTHALQQRTIVRSLCRRAKGPIRGWSTLAP